MTLRESVAAARQRLVAAGIPPEEAALDARLLAQEILGWDAARFLAEAGTPSPPAFAFSLDTLIARRSAREPLAYIVGRREFWNLTFEVSPDVLVPRPETELIIEVTLELFPHRDAQLRACDVGTGSGCLAVAIACERAGAQVVATDVSGDALSVAARNAARHGVADRVALIAGDLFGEIRETFDLIVSNPPYVPDEEREGLPPEVRDHEPPRALFGGHDGLEIIRRLLAAAPARLKAGGWLVFEIGALQADAVRALISSADGLTMTALRRDLSGIPRTAVVRRA